MNWNDVAEMVKHWNDKSCLKGVMSVETMPRKPSILAAPALSYRTMADVSLTDHAVHLTSLQRLSMRSVTKSMSYLTAEFTAGLMY